VQDHALVKVVSFYSRGAFSTGRWLEKAGITCAHTRFKIKSTCDQKDALVEVGNHFNSSFTSQSDYISDPDHKLMLQNHGIRDGKFEFSGSGTEAVLLG
jgi:hypothetical protein